jgi:hypothetical protein
MQKTRYGLIAMVMLLCSVTAATADVRVGIGLPNVSIGINLPLFPELVPVPGYPVYYAPRVNANYFFYDGMYWVYQDDNWYASSWYNGPWAFVEPEAVPLYVLRIPVRYYQRPPEYFRGWRSNAPPRWGRHWGHDWEQRRSGWDRWDRRSVPTRAPRPDYQRQYYGDRYPRVEQQPTLHRERYRYEPRDSAVREHYQRQMQYREPAPDQRGRQEERRMRSPGQQDRDFQRSAPQQRGPEPRVQQPGTEQREQPAPRAQGQGERSQDRREWQEPNRERGQGQNKDEDRGRGHNN